MRRVLIAGLGNPGKEYVRTRHNLGFLLLDSMAEELGWSFKEEKRFKAHIANGRWKDIDLHLIKPQTYMNLSGESIGKYMRYHRLQTENFLVVVDDSALGFGQLRLRGQGSPGGHNGLKNVQAHLNTQNYVRLRMGIGVQKQGSMSSHVLGRFTQGETEQLPALFEKGKQALGYWIEEPLVQAMNKINHPESQTKSGQNEERKKPL